MKQSFKKNIEDIQALTPIQEGMLYHYSRIPGSDQYFEQIILEISGSIDGEIFTRAWNNVIAANEVLRSVFRWEKVERPVQVILKEYTLQPGYHDFTNQAVEETERGVAAVLAADRARPFNLNEVAFRVTLIKKEEKRYEMLISSHHILYDGWSTGIIIKEFFENYRLGEANQPIVIVRKRRFSEFVKWLQGRSKREQQEFWQRYLAGLETRTELPVKRLKQLYTNRADNRGAVNSTGKYSVQMTLKQKHEIENFIGTQRTTLAALIYTAWGVLLQRYVNSEDVIFGTTVSGRNAPLPGIENIVGLFINTIPLRLKGHTGETAIETLSGVQNILQQREEVESTPLAEINQWCGGHGGESFDTIVVIENYPVDSRIANVREGIIPRGFKVFERPHYDLTLSVKVFEGLEFSLIYNDHVFEKQQIELMWLHLQAIILAIIEQPDQELSAIGILSDAEKKQLIVDFNKPGRVYSTDKTMTQLFTGQAEKTPDQIAVSDIFPRPKNLENKKAAQGKSSLGCHHFITYQELNQKSARLAQHLVENGVRRGSIVPLLVERNLEMIIGILGILKTGSAYLPVNPQNPGKRTETIFEDIQASHMVTQRHLFKNLESSSINNLKKISAIFIDDEILPLVPDPGRDVIDDCTGGNRPLPEDIAYVIYTSGSTGKPKGVPITHANICPLLHWGYSELGLGTGDYTLQSPSYFFDWSVWEIFMTLTTGANLHMITNHLLLSPEALIEYMRIHWITVLHVTPSQYHYIISVKQNLSFLRYLFFGAEKLSQEMIQHCIRSVEPDCRIFNMYGPTETTIISTVFEIDRSTIELFDCLTSIPIGGPVGNTTLLVLGRNALLCPLTVPGELYIAGDGVAHGYINRPGLTAEKFINPYQSFIGEKRIDEVFFSTTKAEYQHPYNRLYKTGDLVRWLPGGQIEFLGRLDQQIKIRGFRIEPGEIESLLLSHQTVKEAVVQVYEDGGGDKYICAYIIVKSGLIKFEEITLREYLSQTLPDYMIPSYFIPLQEIPLNANGKLDRKALPIPDVAVAKTFTAPGNEMEEKLAVIFSEVLMNDRSARAIDVNDSFFRLGGHSLKAARLVSRIYKELDINIPIGEIFNRPTIRQLHHYIKTIQTRSQGYESIEKAEEKEFYPLSSAQKRLYILECLTPGTIGYNIPAIFRLEGEISQKTCQSIFEKLVERHESLRTSFVERGNKPAQAIHKPGEIEFMVETYPELEVQMSAIEAIKKFVRPFNIKKAPLFRVGLYSFPSFPEKDDNLLMLDIHHIISDGTSVGILIKEFLTLYSGEPLPVALLQYRDYSEWQQGERFSAMIKEQEKYWLEQYLEKPLPLQLPIDYPRPLSRGYEGRSIPFKPGIEENRALKMIILKEEITPYMLLLALYYVLLSRLSGQEDIVVGTAWAGRRHPDLQSITGFFINTLAVRHYPVGTQTFQHFLGKIKQQTLNDYENQDYPFESLVEKIAIPRDNSRNPLFDVLFVLQNTEIPSLQVPGLKLTPWSFDNEVAKFDLCLIVTEVEEQLFLSMEYSTALFKEATILRFINYFKRLISAVIANPLEQLAAIDILADEEKQQLLKKFNHTDLINPGEKTIHGLFLEQAKRIPGNRAVIVLGTEGKEIVFTYQELNELSENVAVGLREKGVGHGHIVAIMMERSIEMLIVIFGILKAGGGYLPIEPGNPKARNRYLLADSQVSLLLIQDNLEDYSDTKVEMINVTSSTLIKRGNPRPKQEYPSNPEDLAYVLYTSGSTGKPKGVMVSHYPVINLLFALFDRFPFTGNDTYLFKTSYTFDVSVSELFGWIIGGGRLAIPVLDTEKDPGAITQAIRQGAVTHINFTPSMFQVFINTLPPSTIKDLSPLKYIFLAGEPLLPGTVNRFRAINPGILLENLYGPTEATVYASHFSLSTWNGSGNIPIGKPLPNLKFYILSDYDSLQPIGVPGELCISGSGLAKGYLNRPVLTAQRFIVHPFQKNSILYRTGDRARWLADGNIEFLGRIDHQVKIRGYRVELGEIECRLLSKEGIKNTVVIVKESVTGDQYLCAYVVDNANHTPRQLKEYLEKDLPTYMIPRAIVFLKQIPTTPVGKIDRNQLPEPIIENEDKTGYQPPINEIEKKLIGIWKELLAVDRIGMSDNFFTLGGHSLLGITLLSRIRQVFKVEVSLRDLINNLTPRDLSRLIIASSNSRRRAIEPAEDKEYYPATPDQVQVYILSKLEEIGTTYNLTDILILKGQLDIKILEESFQTIVNRHEAFRTSFALVGDVPVQKIHRAVDWSIPFIDAREKGDSEAGLIEKIRGELIKPFDLENAPLLRVTLVRSRVDCHLLLVDLHHIISDGFSNALLVQEFFRLYSGETLPLPAFRYRDFTEWQNRLVKSGELEQQEAYWLKTFAGRLPVLNLRLDFPRPPVQSFTGDTVYFNVGTGAREALKRLMNETGTTLYMILFAVFNVFLYRYTGQEEIITGTVSAGRNYTEMEPIIGMFVKTLAIRNYPRGNQDFIGFLSEVKENLMAAFENQDYPFLELVDKLRIKKDQSRNPLFDVAFIMQNREITLKWNLETGREGFEIQSVGLRPSTSMFDLALEVSETADDLVCRFEYRTSLFERSTVELMRDRFLELIKNILNDPGCMLRDLDFRSPLEKEISGNTSNHPLTDVVDFDF